MKERFKSLLVISLIALSLLFFSCATSGGSGELAGGRTNKYGVKKYKKDVFEKAFEKKDYAECIALLRGKNKKGTDIRDNLDEAMLCYLNDDYEESIIVFDFTDALMREALTKSITKTAGAATLNENISEYTGNIYEYLLINSMNALNFLHLGDLENALVELNKAAVKENEYLREYGELVLKDIDLSSEDNESLSNSAKSLGLNLNNYKADTPKKPTRADLYLDSALTRYLSLVLYTIDGDKSNVEIDARVLASLGSKVDVRDDVNIPRGKGRLDVLALSGFIGRREEAKFETPKVLPFIIPIDGAAPFLFKVKFVWPEYKGQNVTIDKILVKLDTGEEKPTAIIEDFDQALSKDVRLKSNKAFTRSMVRSLTKKTTALAAGTASLVATKEVINNTSGIAQTSAQIAYYAAWKSLEQAIDAVDLSETADIRQGYYFPRIASATGFTLEPGTYSGKVIYYFNGNVVKEEPFADIVIKAGKPTLVVSSCLE